MIQKVIVKYNNKIVGYLIEMEDNKKHFNMMKNGLNQAFLFHLFLCH